MVVGGKTKQREDITAKCHMWLNLGGREAEKVKEMVGTKGG